MITNYFFQHEFSVLDVKVSSRKIELVQRLQSEHIKESQRGSKKRKLNHEEVQEQSSIILNMPVEVIEYIFDYLDIDDLSAVSATCKRMQQLAGRVYQQSYSGLRPQLQGSQRNWTIKIYREYGTKPHSTGIDYLIPFVDKMFSAHVERHKILHPGSKFLRLRQLTVQGASYNTDKINRMKEF